MFLAVAAADGDGGGGHFQRGIKMYVVGLDQFVLEMDWFLRDLGRRLCCNYVDNLSLRFSR